MRGAAALSPGLKWASGQSTAQAEGSGFLYISFTLNDKKWKLKFSTPPCRKTVKPMCMVYGGRVMCTARPHCPLTPLDRSLGYSPLSSGCEQKSARGSGSSLLPPPPTFPSPPLLPHLTGRTPARRVGCVGQSLIGY